PIDGIVAESPANEGDYITTPTTLTTISYTDTMQVEIPIPTTIYLQHKDSLSNITLQLSGSEKYPHKGIYYYTLKDSPTSSSTVVMTAKFPNPEGRLRPGMFGRVRANIGKERSCVVVPQIAVSQNQGVNSVWVMQSDSTVKFTEVELGAATSEGWIVESGVNSGDVVLTSGQLKVHNGAKVSPQKK
ncbi:MAG: efflux RND transporter periplasmic adaptor subunit, partial [Rikenellaceae bacterium]